MKLARIVNGRVFEILPLVSKDMIPADLLAQCIEAPSKVEQGWTYTDGEFLPPDDFVIDLETVKTHFKSVIDSNAETERLKYITAGTGQAMTYQRKVDEAKRLLADTGPITAAEYPLLAASIGIDGATLQAVAAVVLGMDAAWAQIGAQIERIRLTAKQAVDEAQDEAAARSVVAAIIWPSAQQGATDHE